MATSVKMSEGSKRELDRIRNRLSQLQGRMLTVQEVLEALVRAGSKDIDFVLDQVSEVHYPLPEGAMEEILSARQDIGPTSEEDIDVTLYGGRRRRRS
jgi:hypothetical protein